MNHVLQIIDSSDIDYCLDECDFIIIEFSRANVEACLPGNGLDRLMTLSDSAHYSTKFAQAVLFAFDGYGDDPRELCEIPEVRVFVKALHAQWTYWAHFLAPLPDIMGLLYTLLLPVERVETNRGAVAFSIDMKGHAELTLELTGSALLLHEQYGYPNHFSVPIVERFQEVALQVGN